MDKLPFIDKFGRVKYCDDSQTFVRERGYVIIKKGKDVACTYDAASEFFALPAESMVELNAAPTATFSVLSYVYENNRPFKETQTYRFFDVKDADVDKILLRWCSLEDIALRKIMFDATQLRGIKNMLVRVNKDE